MQTLIEYFYRIAGYNWWGMAIELLLIGLVVYWIVDFLEGTRGERLFRGVILVVISAVLLLNLIAERLHLERLQHLYNYFLVFVLVVSVAAFQPELRRALIRIAQPRFLIWHSRNLSRTIEEIIHAVSDLSATKTGAIIVIERKVGLGEFIETGVKIDAVITAELLKTIFYSGTALHDMAVVIRGERIVAARVQLPLAEAGGDREEFGSRHRAAVGASAGSDATIIVVSEETGTISIAENGKLTRNVDDSYLRTHLSSIINSRDTASWLFRQSSRKTIENPAVNDINSQDEV
ncbi:MAG: diadenylate cyclase CdaA [Phycisphaerae bacterium]